LTIFEFDGLNFVHFAQKQQCALYPMIKGTNDYQMKKPIQPIYKTLENISHERGDTREKTFAG
jgi:hypothetical protein